MTRRLCGYGLAAAVAATVWGTAARAADDPKGIAFFESKIRPVLVERCYKCHSTETGQDKGKLKLDSREAMLRGGETGPAIVPGSPEDSLLVEAIRHESLEMPPDKKLPDAVIADFVTWIKLGAPDPRVGGQVVARKEIDIEAGRKFWAFQPPTKHAPPQVKNAAWPRSDVDRFILAGLEAQKMPPVADADRRTLIRRLSFDLVGLPPTPDEVDAFVADASPQALEKLVDRLLASPQFGERWGRHWLDVARYAESNGNADNNLFPHAWRYRDYVVASINADKPYDRFLKEQIAGDRMEAATPRQRDELLTATGFLALGSKPRSQNNPDFQMDVVAEQLEVATTGLMALTVACARCHDHKFDPIPTREYYALAGIFTSTQTLYGTSGNANRQTAGGLHGLTGDEEQARVREEHRTQLQAATTKHDALVAELRKLDAVSAVAPSDRDRRQAANGNAKKKRNRETSAEADPLDVTVIAPIDTTDAEKSRIGRMATERKEIADAIRELRKSTPAPAGSAMGARDASRPADCELCVRGESQKRGDKVPRGFVSVATIGDAPVIPADQSGRLQLAQWIASPRNPLTSRVMVNRIWKHLFGRGIVASVDNFGVLGEKPSHPELLDHLAVRFVEEGWSIKRMVRSLVLTRAYGLSSDHDARHVEADPDNVYVWRHSPHRLDAEALRDAILVVSEQLDRTPPQGSPVAGTGGQAIQNGRSVLGNYSESEFRHRSLYLPIVRNGLPESLELFDMPDPSLVVGSRDVTIVPAQSLYLMNSPFVVEQSRRFAQRLLQAEGTGDEDRIALAFRIGLSRQPTPRELERSRAFLAEAREQIGRAENSESQRQLRAWGSFAQALFDSAEFRYVE